ncbi:MFS transporter [Flavobacteriaceae bacterium]|nr:MFS transporter [Flavobacteriaceae bacterium]MDA8904359.1 MFS transporter [Flavobacteriaceae bacterium]MDB4212842.1 MFS transporter [Flavobacteriaceae bacterium]MDC1310074.1 MFS transporter [Flavobacteriaceae bacterium]
MIEKTLKVDPYSALRFREFNIFLVVRFILVFSWSMQFIIVEWLVWEITKNPLSLGLIGLMEVVPAVSMALFAGHIVDQKEKRNLLIYCIIAFLFVSVGFYLVTSSDAKTMFSSQTILYLIYLLVFIGGFIRAFFGPTIFSLVALIVPKNTYANAATWSSSVWQMGVVLGPAFAGFSIHWIGVNSSMGVVLAGVLVSLLTLSFIKRKPILNPKIGENIFKSLREGVAFVYNSKAILGAITLDMVAVLFGGAIALLPIYATEIIVIPVGMEPSEVFGVLRATPAVGSLITMFIAAYIPITKNAGTKLLIAIFGFGISIITFGLSSLFWISVLSLFIYGLTDGISMVIRQTILQLKTPDHLRGRVASVNSIFVGSSNELGAFESGVTAKLMGTVTAVVFGGTITVLTAIGTAFVSPSFRKLDLTEDEKNT